MIDHFYVGAYWGSRAEPVDICAKRLTQCLAGIGNAHPVLAVWYRQGKSRKKASSGNAIELSASTLEGLLVAGRNRADFGGHIIPELGFGLSLWNNNAAAASFSCSCSVATSVPSIGNCFVLYLPESSGLGAELYETPTARAIFCSIVEAWDPEWATFTSDAIRDAQNLAPGQPVAGWMTYTEGRKTPRVPGNVNARVEDFSKGTLITVDGGPLGDSRPGISAVADVLQSMS